MSFSQWIGTRQDGANRAIKTKKATMHSGCSIEELVSRAVEITLAGNDFLLSVL